MNIMFEDDAGNEWNITDSGQEGYYPYGSNDPAVTAGTHTYNGGTGGAPSWHCNYYSYSYGPNYQSWDGYFYYFFELFTSNELLGAVVMVQPQTVELPPVPLPGIEILAQLGYETGECSRLLGGGGGGCAYSLYVLGGWVAAGLALSYLVLRFCVKDPH